MDIVHPFSTLEYVLVLVCLLLSPLSTLIIGIVAACKFINKLSEDIVDGLKPSVSAAAAADFLWWVTMSAQTLFLLCCLLCLFAPVSATVVLISYIAGAVLCFIAMIVWYIAEPPSDMGLGLLLVISIIAGLASPAVFIVMLPHDVYVFLDTGDKNKKYWLQDFINNEKNLTEKAA